MMASPLQLKYHNRSFRLAWQSRYVRLHEVSHPRWATPFPDNARLRTVLIQNIKQLQFFSIQHRLFQCSFYIIDQFQREKRRLFCQQPKKNAGHLPRGSTSRFLLSFTHSRSPSVQLFASLPICLLYTDTYTPPYLLRIQKSRSL